jgi:hypothetical protein
MHRRNGDGGGSRRAHTSRSQRTSRARRRERRAELGDVPPVAAPLPAQDRDADVVVIADGGEPLREGVTHGDVVRVQPGRPVERDARHLALVDQLVQDGRLGRGHERDRHRPRPAAQSLDGNGGLLQLHRLAV